ncbi:MAG: hypothetical protein ACYSWX_13500 [Planctomycetota bacterium]|jgi:hypothetical protein
MKTPESLRTAPRSLLLASFGFLAAVPLAGALQEDGASDGLRPVAPAAGAAETEPLPATPVGDFDPRLWTARMTDADLDRREMTFEDALRNAQTDAAFRDWVQELARGNDELAWTARLLVRELDRLGSSPNAAPRPSTGTFFGGRPLTPVDVFGSDPFQVFMVDPNQRVGQDAIFEALREAMRSQVPGGVSASGQSMRFQMTPDGVEVELRDSTGGDESVQTYRAEDLEQLLEENPELEGRLGLQAPRTGGGSAVGGAVATPAIRTDILGVRVAATDPRATAAAGLGDAKGLLVFDTEVGTIAHLLGVQRGSVLLDLNGLPLEEVTDISEALSNRPPSGEIRLRWIGPQGLETVRVWRPDVEDAPGEE